jgi:DNA-binding response OmpR family regulator
MNELPQILIVEDEPNIARGLIYNLEEEGFRVEHVTRGEEALDRVRGRHFDLIVLDLMLPGLDGFEICRRLRRHDPRLPILILTARSGEQDRVQGLSLGADDYLTKPFSLEEFLLRVKAILRRSRWHPREGGKMDSYRIGASEVDLKEGRAITPRGEFALTDLELRMLRVFIRQEGEILPRAALLSEVWGMAPDAETRTLDNFIVRLRRYLEPDPSRPVHFLTVRGRGYRFLRTGNSQAGKK